MKEKRKLSPLKVSRLSLRRLPPEERFWASVDKTETCWLWRGKLTAGYGSMMVDGKAYRAHRWAYERFVGPIPEGLFACHKCDVRNCVNPDHIFIGTNADNVRDMVAKGRNKLPRQNPALKTRCKNGHPRTPENTIPFMSPTGPSKQCLICKRATDAKVRLRDREKNRARWAAYREQNREKIRERARLAKQQKRLSLGFREEREP